MVEEERALEEVYYLAIRARSLSAPKVRIEEVMTRNPVALRHGTRVREAIKFANEADLRVYPVVDEGGRIVGYVKVEDLLSIPGEKWEALSEIGLEKPLIAEENDPLGYVVLYRICLK